MEATLQIHNSKVQVNDETLAKLNEALAAMPVIVESYKDDKYVYTADPSKRVQLAAVFELRSVVTKV